MMIDLDARTLPPRRRQAERCLVTLALAALLLVLAGCSSGGGSPTEPPSTAVPALPTLGYAGPSVITRIALGETENFPAYSAWDGRDLVRLNGAGFDGCDVFRWARMDGSSDYCWDNYRQMLAANPGTDRIVFMVGFKPGQELGVDDTRRVAQELQDVCTAHHDDGSQCTIMISGLPDYVGTCGQMPNNGIPALTRNVAVSVAAGTAGMVAGPVFSPVTASDVTDGCHQNQGKRAEHAAELMAYLDAT